MHGEYLGILVGIIVAATISGAMITLSWVLGPKKKTPYKSSPYECGVAPIGDTRERFPIKFYLVAILFVLFDIEVVFLWGWMTVFRHAELEFQIFSFVEMLIYMSTWVLGFVYALRVNAIDWDETTSLAKEKLGDSLPTESRSAIPSPVGGGQ